MLDDSYRERMHILSEALPYIREWQNKTVVVKYGGAAMDDPALRNSVARDLALLHYVGIRVVVVHGGGPQVNDMMKRLGLEPKFVGGLRVTDPATMEVAQMVLVGTVNKELVSLIQTHGGKAVGLSGKDAGLIRACKLESPEGDLGCVGDIVSVDTGVVDVLTDAGYVVVISTIGIGEEGQSYNINADTAAGAVAAALGAEKLIVLSDIPGLLDNVEDENSLISELAPEQAEKLVEDGKVSKGMIPKLQACLKAIEGGVPRAHMIDGRLPHSMLIELFTDAGIGTMIRG
ncbi:MAG: acetylglutamate kinase [Armatimonadia bacterium]